jgi:hypothetical protein
MKIFTLTLLTVLMLLTTSCTVEFMTPRQRQLPAALNSPQATQGSVIDKITKTPETARNLFQKSSPLLSWLIIFGVAGIVLTLWAKIPEGLCLTAGCWSGAVMIVVLAGLVDSIWVHVLGFALLAGFVAFLVVTILKWKKVASAAVTYAQKLKPFVPKDAKEKVNKETEKVQPASIKKAIQSVKAENGSTE